MPRICHLLGPDTPPQRIPLLRALMHADTPEHALVAWRGGIAGCDLPAAVCGLAAPLARLGLAGRTPARRRVEQADLVHAWSPAALHWYWTRSGWHSPRPVLAEADGTLPAGDLVGPLGPAAGVTWLARSPWLADRLRSAGALPARIRTAGEPLVPLEDGEAARQRLGVPPGQRLIALLAADDRKDTFFQAFWGLLVAHKVHADLRVLPVGSPGQVARVQHLARAARLGHAVLPGGPGLEPLAAADLVVWAPRHSACLATLQSVVAAGIPVVMTPGCGGDAVLASGDAWVADSGAPAGIARQVVEALEAPDEAARRAGRARGRLGAESIEQAAEALRDLYGALREKKNPSPLRARVLEES